jgi:hypothetical protein
MAITINGSGTVTGLSVGGLPDGTVDAGTLATNSVDSAELIDGAVDDSHIAALAASKLTGDLPAISGANLTGISSVGGATGVDFNDDVKIRVGTGNDLEIYHDGSNSRIHDGGTGDLILSGNIIAVQNAGRSETMAKFNENSDVKLYYDDSLKFETTDGGIRVSNSSGTILDAKSNRTVEQFGTSGNWMKMMWAGGNSTEYFISFRTQNNTQVGYINTNGSSTTYSTSSDYRLKENVDYTWDATTRLKQLKPARFNFIADDTNTLVDGFIAHEVSSVVPEAITGEKDAMEAAVLYKEGDDIPEGKSVGDVRLAEQIAAQAIDQSKLVPLLVKTIQELEARITALEA